MNPPIERKVRDAAYSNAQDLVLPVIARISSVLAEENAALRSGNQQPIKQCIERKNQGLLEMSNAMALLGSLERSGLVAHSLAQFIGRLEENKRLLQIHYDALKDIAQASSRATEEEMSDRTYTMSRPGRRSQL